MQNVTLIHFITVSIISSSSSGLSWGPIAVASPFLLLYSPWQFSFTFCTSSRWALVSSGCLEKIKNNSILSNSLSRTLYNFPSTYLLFFLYYCSIFYIDSSISCMTWQEKENKIFSSTSTRATRLLERYQGNIVFVEIIFSCKIYRLLLSKPLIG